MRLLKNSTLQFFRFCLAYRGLSASAFGLPWRTAFADHASLDGTPNGFLSPEFNPDVTRIHRFTEGTFEDWHTATLGEVYILYLQGIQQITASSGETHDFSCGEILWLQDTHGKGRQTRVLASGYSVIWLFGYSVIWLFGYSD